MTPVRVVPSVLLACGALVVTTGSDSRRSDPVPPLAQTRMVAEYGRTATFVPSWMPPGFRLHSWAVESGSLAILPDRLRLRFRRGAVDLMWEVAFADRAETADPAACERPRPSRRIGGRRVFDAGARAAYVCIAVGHGSGGVVYGVSLREIRSSTVDRAALRRAVAGAIVASASVRASPLVPPRQARALRRSFDGAVPLPRTLPRGFVFTRGYVQERTRVFPRTAVVIFGHAGRRLLWTVAPTGHGLDTRCTRAGRASYEPRMISGRRVFWARGNKGQSAWMCVRTPMRITVELWSDHSLSARTVMRVVASSRA